MILVRVSWDLRDNGWSDHTFFISFKNSFPMVLIIIRLSRLHSRGFLGVCGVVMLTPFFWCGIAVKKNSYCGVAVISNLTVYDVCNFKPTVFGEINYFRCCSVFFFQFILDFDDMCWLTTGRIRLYFTWPLDLYHTYCRPAKDQCVVKMSESRQDNCMIKCLVFYFEEGKGGENYCETC